MVIILAKDPTVPQKWGVQLCWWRYQVQQDFVTHRFFWQPSFLGYFR